MRTSLLVPLLILSVAASGCDDPLSPDEQRRLLEQIADPTLASGGSLGEADLPLEVLSILPHAEIAVELDGDWVRFRAVVVEYVPIPDTGHYGSLSRNVRMMLAWRTHDLSERFVLGGIAFPGPMRPYLHGGDPLLEARPVFLMRGGDRRTWRNRSGQASLAPIGQLRDRCVEPLYFSTAFGDVRPDGTFDSTSTGGFRCEEMMYEVGFQANLGDRHDRTTDELTVRMLPQHVPGIRMTRECDGTDGAIFHFCGNPAFAPGPCQLHPDRAECWPPGIGPPVDTSATRQRRVPR